MASSFVLPRLCYVEGCWAYFTTQALDKQWGDDWNDAPYEHNAEPPYEPHELTEGEHWKIYKLAFDADLLTPCDGFINSRYSVEQINSGAVPWLRSWDSDPDREIYAGTSMLRFCALVEASGGTVYTPRRGTVEGDELLAALGKEMP